jgi:2-keto-4-pentenoate hydratase/2-oxohepta-3-ene-1,7-dioic acid hydratase in catechol pathway
VRVANLDGRAVLVTAERALDIAQASDGRFGPDPMQVLADWDEFRRWAAAADTAAGQDFEPDRLGAPVPRPRQVFAVALNYRPHAAEAGFTPPEVPLIFTKFPSCITGPYGEIATPPGKVDWELELVAVLARDAYQVGAADAWDALAGLTIGQDISERSLQLTGTPPQFSLAKSHPGFGPIGPCLTTVDELTDPETLELVGTLNGEVVQRDRLSSMIFSVPELVAFITSVCPVFAGDLIFTGTPAGVGNRRNPPRFLGSGDELVSEITGLGVMRHAFR